MRFPLAVLCGVACAVLMRADTIPNYTIINPPGDIWATATGINNLGQVVGTDVYLQPFLYQNSDFQHITIPLPGFGVQPIPAGINDHGGIAGTYDDMFAGQLGFFYQNGTVASIVAPGSPSFNSYTYITGVNNSGQVVGFSPYGFAFIYQNGAFTTFQAPNAYSTAFFGINNNGAIVGDYSDDTGDHAFLYNHGSISLINAPDSVFTRPLGINDAGEIVGYYEPSAVFSPGEVAYLDNNGVFTTFNYLGADKSQLVGINDAGEATGNFQDEFGDNYAFVQDLGAPVATPEPASASLLAAGLTALLANTVSRRARRRRASATV